MTIIDTVKLTTAVKRAALRVNKRSVMPILSGILLEIGSEGEFAVTGTDLDSYFKTGNVGKAVVSVVVEPKALLAALKLINKEVEVVLELTGEVLKVTSTQGHVTVNVPTLGFGEDFPSPDNLYGGDFEAVTALPEQEINVLADKIAPVCASYDTASVLRGINFKHGLVPGTTQVCGTDGSRLVVATFDTAWQGEPVTIPAHIFDDLTGPVVIQANSHWARITDTLGATWVKLIPDQYPSYEQILPPVGESQGYREYNRKQLIEALKSIKRVPENKRLQTAAFVGLRVASLGGEVVLDLNGASSDRRAIGLNVNYLLDWASSQKGEFVEFTLSGAQNRTERFYCKPVMLKDEQFGTYGVRHLLMPVALKSAWANKHTQSIEQTGDTPDVSKGATVPTT